MRADRRLVRLRVSAGPIRQREVAVCDLGYVREHLVVPCDAVDIRGPRESSEARTLVVFDQPL